MFSKDKILSRIISKQLIMWMLLELKKTIGFKIMKIILTILAETVHKFSILFYSDIFGNQSSKIKF
jgi:hypothetical protein